MVIGNSYCVTFSNSYAEETSAKFQPVSYLIKIKSISTKAAV